MSGLVLEGGGMRGVYTAGVLDFFLDKNIEFENVYGVSAGAINACNYLAKQRRRSFRVTADYIQNKDYASLRNLLLTGDFFGVEMCYDIVPNQLDLYDYEEYQKYQGNFYVVVTNCITGQAEYKRITDMKKEVIYVRASSSLPFMAREVMIHGIPYLDGGIADSIPIRQARRDGNRKNVIILTRDREYQKRQLQLMGAIRIRYRKYPQLVKSVERRYLVYNKTLEYIHKLSRAGKALVIQPQNPVKTGKLEKNKKKLNMLYQEGYQDAEKKYEQLQRFLEL